MEDNNQIQNTQTIFKPFRQNGNETPLHIVYKAMMARYDSEQALALLKDFCLTSISVENQRRGLELLYMSSFFDELEELILVNKQSENEENRQWAYIYDIMLERRKSGETVDPYKILAGLDKVKPLSQEVELLKVFLTMYSYNSLRKNGTVGSYFDTLHELTSKIDDPLMAVYFNDRLQDFLMFYHFLRNELILCRRYGYRLLNRTHNTFKHCVAHQKLALTYALESYEQALYHSNEALRIAEQNGYTRLSHSITDKNLPFISAVNGVYEGVTTTDPIEQAHLDIARGNIDEAVEVLEKIEQPSPFQEYYLGKALNDMDRLLSAYHRFTRSGNHFAAQFPIHEIKRIRKLDIEIMEEHRLA